MTTQKEPREFWVTEPTLNRTCRGHTLAYNIKKHPTPPKRPELHMEHFKVIEHSAYLQMKKQRDMAVRYLKKAQGAMIKCECHLDEVEEIDKILGEIKEGE